MTSWSNISPTPQANKCYTFPAHQKAILKLARWESFAKSMERYTWWVLYQAEGVDKVGPLGPLVPLVTDDVTGEVLFYMKSDNKWTLLSVNYLYGQVSVMKQYEGDGYNVYGAGGPLG